MPRRASAAPEPLIAAPKRSGASCTKMSENPYNDPQLRAAWAKGKAARKRHGSRSSNPYSDSALSMAWNAGFDATAYERARKRSKRAWI